MPLSSRHIFKPWLDGMWVVRCITTTSDFSSRCERTCNVETTSVLGITSRMVFDVVYMFPICTSRHIEGRSVGELGSDPIGLIVFFPNCLRSSFFHLLSVPRCLVTQVVIMWSRVRARAFTWSWSGQSADSLRVTTRYFSAGRVETLGWSRTKPTSQWDMCKFEDGRVVHLNLSNLGLTNLPESIGQLTALRELWCGINYFTSLPDSIGQLTSLVLLWCYNNQIESLPESLRQCTRLKAISCGFNKIANLPKSLARLVADLA